MHHTLAASAACLDDTMKSASGEQNSRNLRDAFHIGAEGVASALSEDEQDHPHIIKTAWQDGTTKLPLLDQ